MRLYVVRHGQPDVSRTERPLDWPLTELGHRQASRVGQWMAREGVSAIYTSPLRRAAETAGEICAATGLVACARPDFSEYFIPDSMRDFRGLTVAELKCAYAFLALPADMPEDGWWPRWPETWEDLDRRVVRLARELIEAWGRTEAAVVLVGHGATCKSIVTAVTGRVLTDEAGHSHCGVTLLEWAPESGGTIVFLNRTDLFRPTQ